jgi:hypothetical protein
VERDVPEAGFTSCKLLPLKLDLAIELRTGSAATPTGLFLLNPEALERATTGLTAVGAMQAEAIADLQIGSGEELAKDSEAQRSGSGSESQIKSERRRQGFACSLVSRYTWVPTLKSAESCMLAATLEQATRASQLLW